MVDILLIACRTTSSRNISGRTVSKSVLNEMLEPLSVESLTFPYKLQPYLLEYFRN